MIRKFRKRLRDEPSSASSSNSSSENAPSTKNERYTISVSKNPFSSSSPATRRPGQPHHNAEIYLALDSYSFADRPGMNAFTTPSNEPPPAYTPTPQYPTTPEQVPAEDRYAFLSSFDTIFVIDDSGS